MMHNSLSAISQSFLCSLQLQGTEGSLVWQGGVFSSGSRRQGGTSRARRYVPRQEGIYPGKYVSTRTMRFLPRHGGIYPGKEVTWARRYLPRQECIYPEKKVCTQKRIFLTISLDMLIIKGFLTFNKNLSESRNTSNIFT